VFGHSEVLNINAERILFTVCHSQVPVASVCHDELSKWTSLHEITDEAATFTCVTRIFHILYFLRISTAEQIHKTPGQHTQYVILKGCAQKRKKFISLKL